MTYSSTPTTAITNLYTTMSEAEAYSDDDVRALHTSLSGASYYDIHLSLEDGEFTRRLKLIDVQVLHDTSIDVPAGATAMKRKLWPALVFASFNDLRSQLEDNNCSPVEKNAGRFMTAKLLNLAHIAARASRLNITNAGFVHLLGMKHGESSIVAINPEFAACLVDEMGNSSMAQFDEEASYNTQNVIFDYYSYHELEMGRALVNADHQLIVAFQIAFARREGLLEVLKENGLMFQFDVTMCEQELTNVLRQATWFENKLKLSCIDAFSNAEKRIQAAGQVDDVPSVQAVCGSNEATEDGSPAVVQADDVPSMHVDDVLSVQAVCGTCNGATEDGSPAVVQADDVPSMHVDDVLSVQAVCGSNGATEDGSPAVVQAETSMLARGTGGVTPNSSSDTSRSSCLPTARSHSGCSSIDSRVCATPIPIHSPSQVLPSPPLSPIAATDLTSRYPSVTRRSTDRLRILERNANEDTALIQDLLNASPRLSYGLVLVGDIIDYQSLQTLLPCEWLNDVIINGFLLRVLKPKLPHSAGVYIMSSFFMSTLLQTGEDGRAPPRFNSDHVKNWDRRIRTKGKILGKRVIIVPINHKNSHWLFLWANTDEYKIRLCDPQGRKATNMLYLEAMRDYLDGKRSDYEGVDGWTEEQPHRVWELIDVSESSPRQYNDFDCGVFTLVNITLLSQGLPLEEAYSEKTLQQNATRERLAFLLWETSRNRPTLIPDEPSTTRRPMTRSRRSSLSPTAKLDPVLSTSSSRTAENDPVPSTSSSRNSSQPVHMIPSSSELDTSPATSPLRNLFVTTMPSYYLCRVCDCILIGATEIGCCGVISCSSCLPAPDTCCTSCGTQRCLSGDKFREDVDTSINEAIIYCPLFCGWAGALMTYPGHRSFCSQAQFETKNIRSDDELVQVEIQRRVETLVLKEELVFRHHQCSRRLRELGAILFDMARSMVASEYTSRLHELKLRDSILSRAIAILMRGMRPHEKVVNSISGKGFGGGVQ